MKARARVKLHKRKKYKMSISTFSFFWNSTASCILFIVMCLFSACNFTSCKPAKIYKEQIAIDSLTGIIEVLPKLKL